MKLNFTRRVSIQLPKGECIEKLEDAVNDESNLNFQFPLIGKYKLTSSSQRRFNVAPMFFKKGPAIEGFVEDDFEVSSIIYIRVMPPIWFLLIVGFFPLLIIGFIPNHFSVQVWLVFGIWFLLWSSILLANICCSLRLIRGFDIIFQSLNAQQALPKPFSIKHFCKKLGIYLLVTVLYILALIMLGTVGSALSK